jgi:hypothetical protein
MVKLFDQTLTGTGRFDITGIPPGFAQLKCYLLCRSDVADTTDTVLLLFNGDTTAANYRNADHASGTTHEAGVIDSARISICTGNTATAAYFSDLEFTIQDYAASHSKQATSFGGERWNATTIYNRMHMLHWESTAVINQITLQPDGYATDEFMASSRLQLWGIY